MENKTYAEEIFDKNHVEKHVKTLFENIEPQYGRWTTPIKYRIIGKMTERSLASVASIFEYLERLTNVKATKAVSDDDANFLIIFSDGFEQLADNVDIQKIFMNEGESVGQFKKRMT
ncbi:MAG: hypothetical protein ABJN43_00520, partial [Sneathiella sp.]